MIACDRDIACVQVADAINVEGGLGFGVGHGSLVEELIFVLSDDVDNRCGVDVVAVGFRVDGNEYNFVLRFQVVKGAITAAFASFDIAIFDTGFVDDSHSGRLCQRLDALDSIARSFALNQLV